MSKYLKKGHSDCWPWLGSADTAPNKDAKMACDNPMCCNPRHVVEGGGEVPENSDSLPTVGEDDGIEETVESLRETCEERGIPFDKRWGVEKLKAAINPAPAAEEDD